MMRPLNAPGCFGIGTVCETNKAYCKKCPVNESCRTAAIESLHKASLKADMTLFKARFGLSAAITPSEPLTDDEINLVTNLSGKAQHVLETMLKRNIRPLEFVQAKVNPYVENRKPRFMFAIFDLLIKQGEFTRKELTDAISEIDASWSSKTCASHVSASIRIFEVTNTIIADGDRYILRK